MTIQAGKTALHSFYPADSLAAEALDWEFIDAADITVQTAAGALLLEGIHYSITGNSRVGAASITPLVEVASDVEWLVFSTTPRRQQLDLTTSRAVDIAQFERELDRLQMIVREQDRDLARTVQAPLGEDGFVLPPLAERTGFVGWDGAGGLIGVDLPGLSVSTSVIVQVTSRVTAAAIVGALPDGTRVYLDEGGRSGEWKVFPGTAPAVSDLFQVLYIQGAGKYLARIWNGIGRAEWAGAVKGDPGVESAAAINTAIAICRHVRLEFGNYYGSVGIAPSIDESVLEGAGPNTTFVIFDDPNINLYELKGTVASGVPTYKERGTLRNLCLRRTVNPTTPADPADDNLTGHGCRLSITSNPIIEHVYTENNLVDLYINNVASANIYNVRGLRGLGSGTDRAFGTWIDGRENGVTTPFPSPNPSCYVEKTANGISGAAAVNGIGFYVTGRGADLFADDNEVGGYANGAFFNFSGGVTAGQNMRVNGMVLDGHTAFGLRVFNAPEGSTLTIRDCYIGSTADSTSGYINIDSSNGVKVIDFRIVGDTSPDGSLGTAVFCTNNYSITLKGSINNVAEPLVETNNDLCEMDIEIYKSAAMADSTAIITSTGGGKRNHVKLRGRAPLQNWTYGFITDGSIENYTIDVTQLDPTIVTNKIFIGSNVTAQGNVSGHNIFQPGGGALA